VAFGRLTDSHHARIAIVERMNVGIRSPGERKVVVAMGRKITRILAVGVLLAVGTFAVRAASDRSAEAADHATGRTPLRSARGLHVSIKLTDYSTGERLRCGGRYVIQSWVAAKVQARASTAGSAQLTYLTDEDNHKYWHASTFSVHLTRGLEVIGRTDQWPDRNGDRSTYTFHVQLYRQTDRLHHPQASDRCTVTVRNPR
jgi:hypothetical protein